MRILVNRALVCAGRSLLIRQAQTAPLLKEKWDLYAGVLVERVPVVTKSLTPLEKEFKEMLDQIEFNKSLKSNHEVRKETEKRQLQLVKAGKLDLDGEALKQTAQDLEDAYNEEFSKFQPAARVTEADRKNDVRSLERKLEATLVLLIEHKLGNDKLMLLPQGKHQPGESLRETAERVLRERCGSTLPVTFYGNAPIGFYKYKYPAKDRNEIVGAKVFFFRSLVNPASAVNIKDVPYQWLEHAELQSVLKEKYFKSVSQFLIV